MKSLNSQQILRSNKTTHKNVSLRKTYYFSVQDRNKLNLVSVYYFLCSTGKLPSFLLKEPVTVHLLFLMTEA